MNKIYQHTPYYDLVIRHKTDKTLITMVMVPNIVSTTELPQTYTILSKFLPSIFKSKCFNKNKYTFEREVRNTELGHLFEHILLEYLCLLKCRQGCSWVIFKGETVWNWKRTKRGTFFIDINSPQQDKKVFYDALTLAVGLMNKIVESERRNYHYSIDTLTSNHAGLLVK